MDSETFFINLKKPAIQDQEHIKKVQDIRKILKFIPPIHHHFCTEALVDEDLLPAVLGID